MYANATKITGSGVVSAAGNDYVFNGIALTLTSTDEGDLAMVRVYDGSDATGTLVGTAEVWYNQEHKDTHRTHTLMLTPGVLCTSGMYVEVVTETNGGSPAYKCAVFWH